MKRILFTLGGVCLAFASQIQAQTLRSAHGDLHTLAVTPYGRVIAAGDNTYGQLGLGHLNGDGGTATYYREPVEVQLPLTNGSDMIPVVAVAAGDFHSLALANNGKVFAWGRNNNGQLGQGNTVNSSLPVQVKINDGTTGGGGLPDPAVDPVVAIASGENHCLARTQTGKLYAWGLGTAGQIGNGQSVTQNYARQVAGALASGGVTYIAAGGRHNLAIYQNGVWTWGSDQYNQLGHGAGTNLNTPTKINNAVLTGAIRVAGGANHSLALVGTSVYAWGSNANKQVANTAQAMYGNPQLVSGLVGEDVKEIAAGVSHSLALCWLSGRTDGVILGWGANGQGQLGDGTTTSPRGNPVTTYPPFSSSGYFTTVAAGGRCSSGFKSDGTLAICGDNAKGQIGNAVYPTAPVDQTRMIFGINPSEVTASNTASWSSYFTAKTIGVKPTGRSWMWGNGVGNFGGTIADPSPIANPVSAWKARTTEEVIAWLTYGGSVFSRARAGIPGGSEGLHGNNTATWAGTPVAVVDSVGNVLSGLVDFSFAQWHAAAVSISGTVYTWGHGPGGGLPGQNRYARPVTGITGATAVVAVNGYNDGFVIILKNDGTVWHASGGTATSTGVSGIAKLIGARGRAVGLDAAGSPVFLWGTPSVTFDGITGLVDIAVGSGHWLGLKADGSVWTWGINWEGQLGDGTMGIYESGTPRRVAGIAKAVSVGAGDFVSSVVTSDGTLRMWGRNEDKDLGDGTTAMNQLRPVIVQSFDYRWKPTIDSDGDDLPDTWENQYFGSIYGTDGFADQDADGDGLSDKSEFLTGGNPLNPDSDNDGINDLAESQAGTSPSNPDTDGDGMTDGGELAAGLNPTVNDANGDNDGDGVSNLNEYLEGTNPGYRVNLQVFTPLQN
jgi:alpha-tubulin suppressor-like RCC1 family protein